jgi:hypothetical protein
MTTKVFQKVVLHTIEFVQIPAGNGRKFLGPRGDAELRQDALELPTAILDR